MTTYHTRVKQSRLGSTDPTSQRSGSQVVKLEAWSGVSRGDTCGDGTLIRGMRNKMETVVRRQAPVKGSILENPQRKMIDSAFSTVKLRAMDTGIKRRKALKSGWSQ